MAPRVLIMAGGTGGHVFPALAVALELQQRGATVSWLGTQRGLEAEVIPKAGIDIDWVTIGGLRGKGLLGWLMAPLRLSRAMAQTYRVFRVRKPSVVLGMGGFVTGPGGLVAWLSGTPLVIHEQNALPGMTNRWLARIATRVLTAFPVAFDHRQTRDVGNPIRSTLTHLPAPDQRFAGRTEGALHLLVVGGSLGAKALNDTVPAALALLPVVQRHQVWHQTGKKNLVAAQATYAQAGVEGRVVPFIDDMAEAYAWADLVICRAGALTISELAAVGVGAILVPFPHAVDDHQTVNAKYLADCGAALLVPQTQLSAEKLAAMLRDLNREKLLAMARKARHVARPHATAQVADVCQEVARV
ncbi:MAG: undecaprenyldiphospho-muramoylpentapeptide beta-N-acetylglucosaminyltransferase [Pseudomonadota bacterium]